MGEASLEGHIPGLFRLVAAERREAPCIYEDGRGLSFHALDRRSDALAEALVSHGLRPGDRLALLCPNGQGFVVAYLGGLKAGATLVPLNLLLHPRELGFILRDSGARGLIHHQHLDASADQAAEGLGLQLRVRIGDSQTVAPLLAFSELIRDPRPTPPRLALDPHDSVAAILYTSGTTGRPKGAMLTHSNLVSNSAGVVEALRITPQDRLLVVLPLFHAFAATVGMLTPLLRGGALIPVSRFDPKLVSQAIGTHGATVFLGVPSMYNVLLRMDESMLSQWASVRLCVSGGAALPAAVMTAFEERFQIPILEGDGPTECSPVTCVNPPDGLRKPGSVGLPIPGVEMRILDGRGREVPDGVAAEVCVRGPNVMKGYFNLPEATRDAFFGDWFRTGDLGTRDADGFYYLVDRIKDLIIVNGMNVYPRVIEEALYAHPAVAEAAVVGDPDPRHGEIPVAHLVVKTGVTVCAGELRDWCRARLGRHEIPRRFVIHGFLPRNAAGKILKRELRRGGEQERGVASLDP